MKNISKTYTKLRSAHACLLGAGALILGIPLLIPNLPLNTANELISILHAIIKKSKAQN